ncbi:MAG: lipoyl synthase [Paludibacter sp.]|jgi:lipoic acid synthetase|nr:lipoyl synthase [Paludibacter sp.]
MTYIRKPEWLKTRIFSDNQFSVVSDAVKIGGLHTICTSGRCPNHSECWNRGTATFMIGGEVCTRSCRFCNTLTGKPQPLNADEPQRVAQSVKSLALRHVVVTSVDRDDLTDKGAAHWAATIRAIKQENPATTIEVLIPDFDGKTELIDLVINEKPNVVSHNLETVRRLTPQIRTKAKYETSLNVLKHIAASGTPAKTGIMLGLGEEASEILQTMDDALAVGVTIFTMGQYLQPSRQNIAVSAYIHPEKFAEYRKIGLQKGFRHVESAPFVRSSYHAERHVC